MKFEISFHVSDVVNTFTFEFENENHLADFLYCDGKVNIASHAIAFSAECANEVNLVGLLTCSNIPCECENTLRRKSEIFLFGDYGYTFSEFMNFITYLYEFENEVEITVSPIDSKYHNIHMDSTFSDEELDSADDERFFYYHFSNELEKIISSMYDLKEELEKVTERDYPCVSVFNSEQVQKALDILKVKEYLLYTLSVALDELSDEYYIDI